MRGNGSVYSAIFYPKTAGSITGKKRNITGKILFFTGKVLRSSHQGKRKPHLAHRCSLKGRSRVKPLKQKPHSAHKSSPKGRSRVNPQKQRPHLAHTSTPKGRSRDNPGRRSEATTPGDCLIHLSCTPKGRSSESTASPYTYICQSTTASAFTSCVRRCAPSGCNGMRSDTGGVVTTFLRPRLTTLRPFGVGISANAHN